MPDSDWQHETGKNVQEGVIHSLHTKEYSKIFKLEVRKASLSAGQLCLKKWNNSTYRKTSSTTCTSKTIARGSSKMGGLSLSQLVF